MKNECVMVVVEYDSPSGYYKTIEASKKEAVKYPFRLAKGCNACDYYMRVTVEPGEYLLVKEYKNDDDDETLLIQIPSDEEGFARFQELVESCAGLQVHERILGYMKSTRRKGLAYDYSNDFYGGFLRKFSVQSWKGQRGRPRNIKHALSMIGRS